MLQLIEFFINVYHNFAAHLQNLKEKTNIATLVLAVVLSCFFYPIGGANALSIGLIVFVLFDYITGIRRSQKLGTLSSSKGTKGLEKKIFMYFVIVMANIADKALGLSDFSVNWRTAVTAMYLGLEGVSIFENLEEMGFHTPKGLKKFFGHLLEKERTKRKNGGKK